MKKFEKLLIDTSALIEYMRGNRQAKELINSVDIAETSHYFGQIKSALEKVGKPIPVNDVWIAALAKQNGLPLLAQDTHFRLVSDIELVELT